MKTKILGKLKPKAAPFGFNERELEGIAAQMAVNLGTEEATDEQIDAQIEAAIPFLRAAQSNSNRVIEENRKRTVTPPQTTPPATPQSAGGEGNPTDEPAWFKTFRENTEKELNALKGEKVLSNRKERLTALLKDTGTFGKSTLKAFEKMAFKDDAEFEEYVTEVTESKKEIDVERVNLGLKPLSNPIAGDTTKDKAKKLSEAEIDDIVDKMN